jgi:hypothetical protein
MMRDYYENKYGKKIKRGEMYSAISEQKSRNYFAIGGHRCSSISPAFWDSNPRSSMHKL